jgi:hypothetical protein
MNKKPFPFSAEHNAFMRSFIEQVGDRVRIEQQKYVAKSNIQFFNHGLRWQSHNSSAPDEVSSLKKFSHETSFPIDDIMSYRLDLISEKVEELSQNMAITFARELFQTVSSSCEKSGNIVEGHQRTPAQSFLEVLERVEFGVNRDGEPVLPSLHLGPEAFNAFKNDPIMQNPEFQRRVQEIKTAKIEAARLREAERLSKFKKVEENE